MKGGIGPPTPSKSRRMHRNPCSGGLAGTWFLDPSQPRTSVLVLGCLLLVLGCLGAGAGADLDGGGGLEASMTSSFLQEFQEASEGFGSQTQQDPVLPGSLLDAAAVVGRLFQMQLPQQLDGHMTHVVQVSRPHFL